MPSEASDGAWLETPGRDAIRLQGSLSIGRSRKNTIVLDSPSVSRCHAIINVQNVGEFWLVDLGSSNGTFLNERRVRHPVKLSNGDQIGVGNDTFVFREPLSLAHEYESTLAQQTIRQVKNVSCWLLIADIENFTPLSRSLGNDELAVVVGGWFAACHEIVERHHGAIDKYLGDGFLAYWRDEETAAEHVAEALQKLQRAQNKAHPRFRLALHCGLVGIGGIPSMGEESLIGADLNFAFRMEKLAGARGLDVIISAVAKSKLDPFLKVEFAGTHQVKGFQGDHDFFTC